MLANAKVLTRIPQDQKFIAKKRMYVELSTLKTGLFFTTVKLKELATEYQETVAKYKAKQSKLVGEIVGIAATYAPILEDWNGVIAHLDVIIRYVWHVWTRRGLG